MKSWIYLIPAFLWSIAIFLLSIGDGVQLPESGIALDKVGHFAAYFVLNVLVVWGFWKSNEISWRGFLWISFASIFYGFGLEVVQLLFFPHRYFELWDILANIIGVFVSLPVFYFFITKT